MKSDNLLYGKKEKKKISGESKKKFHDELQYVAKKTDDYEFVGYDHCDASESIQ